jgi:hypothetical protein
MLFIEAMCLFQLKNYSKSYEKLEDCQLTSFYFMKALKMMIIIKILEKDFYEASHLTNSLDKQSQKIEID